ncbi:VOC family protein [Streptomyces sp. NPDC097619]|uniref:VOC family protein n=1 Tax=Streptomyces sp. NPDC097619 TaxID=3157228 RepID=UPI003325C3E4
MLTGIVIDALDVPRLELFWREATRGRTHGLRLRFATAAEPKPAGHKNRLHLDLAGGPDREAELDRLLALGARHTDIGQGDVPWDVLADPEGNEFCLLRPGHHGVLADSGLVAVCLDVAEADRPAQEEQWPALAGWPVAESREWGFRLRRTPTAPVSLLMGPPAAPARGRNRLRPEITDPSRKPGEYLDSAGNAYHLVN